MPSFSLRVLLVAVVWVVHPVTGQQVLQPENFNQSTNPQLFGAGMDFSDGVLAISGPFGRPTGGSCSLFEFDGQEWVFQQLIPGNRGSFGRDVAIEGEWVVIGTPIFDTASVYRRQGVTWIFFQELSPNGGGTPGTYGNQVLIEGGIMCVCDPTFMSPGSIGAVFVYEFNGVTWSETDTLGQTSTAFGRTIDLDGSRLVVGTGDSETYIYERVSGVWTSTDIIINAVGPLPGVKIDGDRVVLAGPQRNNNTGIAFVYEYDGVSWLEVAELNDPDGQPGDFFGSSTSVDGDEILIGATGVDEGRGKLFRFRKIGSDWILQPTAPSPMTPLLPDDLYGAIVLVSPPWTFVSAPGVDGPLAEDVGAAFAFGASSFVRGDVNGDGVFQPLPDVIYLLSYQFSGGAAPPCDDASDVDDDGLKNGLLDALYLLNASFVGGSSPIPAPNTCDQDTTDDALGCAAVTCP